MKQLRGIELKRFLRRFKKPPIEVYLLLENIQYARNVASIFRTAEAYKVKKIFLVGISHKPPFGKDLRKVSRNKEKSVPWEYYENAGMIINKMKNRGYKIVALELTNESKKIDNIFFSDKILLVAGNETYGIVEKTLSRADLSLFIPMYGKGSSLSVSISTAIALDNLVNYQK